MNIHCLEQVGKVANHFSSQHIIIISEIRKYVVFYYVNLKHKVFACRKHEGSYINTVIQLQH